MMLPPHSSTDTLNHTLPNDDLFVQTLLRRYRVSRQTLYKYFRSLGITSGRHQQQAYVTPTEREQLDALVALLRSGHYNSIAEAAAVVLATDEPTAILAQSPPPLTAAPARGLDVRHITAQPSEAGWLQALPSFREAFSRLIDLLQVLRDGVVELRAPTPYERIQTLEGRHRVLLGCVADDIRISTKEVALLVALQPTTVAKRASFERCGFRFTKTGRMGRESEWQVRKVMAAVSDCQGDDVTR